jgi:hypothetical protein
VGWNPPEAIRQAQIRLRDTTNSEKKEYYRQFLPEFSPIENLEAHMPMEVAERLYNFFALEDDDARAFAHPFHWATF